MDLLLIPLIRLIPLILLIRLSFSIYTILYFILLVKMTMCSNVLLPPLSSTNRGAYLQSLCPPYPPYPSYPSYPPYPPYSSYPPYPPYLIAYLRSYGSISYCHPIYPPYSFYAGLLICVLLILLCFDNLFPPLSSTNRCCVSTIL